MTSRLYTSLFTAVNRVTPGAGYTILKTPPPVTKQLWVLRGITINQAYGATAAAGYIFLTSPGVQTNKPTHHTPHSTPFWGWTFRKTFAGKPFTTPPIAQWRGSMALPPTTALAVFSTIGVITSATMWGWRFLNVTELPTFPIPFG